LVDVFVRVDAQHIDVVGVTHIFSFKKVQSKIRQFASCTVEVIGANLPLGAGRSCKDMPEESVGQGQGSPTPLQM
jgi:hypothetical protein